MHQDPATEESVKPSASPSPLLAERYWQSIRSEAPRVLGLMDREPLSPTVGCGDRTFWAWKFVDYPGARFQESLCVLSFLWNEDRPDNPYYRSGELLRWIEQGLTYWGSIQYGDGSFDEAYPLERSLAATAFTTVYVSEGLGFLGEGLSSGVRAKTVDHIRRAADWLCRNDESHGLLSNHLAAAAAACAHAHTLTGDARFDERGRHFIGRILKHQSEEGWYEEYGGPDPGYQTHGSFYLARYLQLTDHEELERSLAASVDWIAHFIHPDGSLGGEYASRNTKTYYPAAFEMLAPESPAAAWVAARARAALFDGRAAANASVDSYNYFPTLNNLVFAYSATRDAPREGHPVADPTPTSGVTYFPEAGLLRYRTNVAEAFVGLSKGGVVKAFDRTTGDLLLSDSGYIGRLEGGRLVSNQYLDTGRSSSVEGGELTVSGVFMESTRPTMRPSRFVAFRLFSLTAGRVPAAAAWLKRLLVKVLINRRKEIPISFRRQITLNDSGLTVFDQLQRVGDVRLEHLEWAPVLTTIHMGSARYFVANELWDGDGNEEIPDATSRTIETARLGQGLELTRSVRWPSTGDS